MTVLLKCCLNGLNATENQLTLSAMKLVYAMSAWLIMGLVLGLGLYLLIIYLVTPGHDKGSPWLFIVSVVGFIVSIGKIGCKTH